MPEALITDLFDTARGTRVSLVDTFIKGLSQMTAPSKYQGLNKDAFFATRLKIKDKVGKVERFVMNKAQWDFDQKRTGRDIILKARQLGFSTLEQATIYHSILMNPGISCVTIANEGENTAHLVSVFDRFHTNFPVNERPHRKGRYPYGISFPDSDSVVYIGTAGNRNWGRGKTVHHVHASEVAFWPDARTTMSGLLESIPGQELSAHTQVTLESTANGAGGYFYELVMSSLLGQSEWTTHFYPWWWAEEYRLSLLSGERIAYTDEEQALVERVMREESILLSPQQIKWRRDKIVTLKEEFQQEYPESIMAAFLTSGRPRFHMPALESRRNTQIMEAKYVDHPTMSRGVPYYMLRIYEEAIKGAEYVVGADVAEGITITSGGEADFSAAVVRHKRDNRQVATIHGRMEPYEFATLLADLGVYYNNALLGVERNNHGHAVLGFLQRGTGDGKVLPYPNIYVHLEDERLGWPTTPKTRPQMMADLAAEYGMPDTYIIRDEEIIREAMTFTVAMNGREQASPGSFDDLVFADAIACEMRLAPLMEREVIYKPVRLGDF